MKTILNHIQLGKRWIAWIAVAVVIAMGLTLMPAISHAEDTPTPPNTDNPTDPSGGSTVDQTLLRLVYPSGYTTDAAENDRTLAQQTRWVPTFKFHSNTDLVNPKFSFIVPAPMCAKVQNISVSARDNNVEKTWTDTPSMWTFGDDEESCYMIRLDHTIDGVFAAQDFTGSVTLTMKTPLPETHIPIYATVSADNLAETVQLIDGSDTETELIFYHRNTDARAALRLGYGGGTSGTVAGGSQYLQSADGKRYIPATSTYAIPYGISFTNSADALSTSLTATINLPQYEDVSGGTSYATMTCPPGDTSPTSGALRLLVGKALTCDDYQQAASAWTIDNTTHTAQRTFDGVIPGDSQCADATNLPISERSTCVAKQIQQTRIYFFYPNIVLPESASSSGDTELYQAIVKTNGTFTVAWEYSESDKQYALDRNLEPTYTSLHTQETSLGEVTATIVTQSSVNGVYPSVQLTVEDRFATDSSTQGYVSSIDIMANEKERSLDRKFEGFYVNDTKGPDGTTPSAGDQTNVTLDFKVDPRMKITGIDMLGYKRGIWKVQGKYSSNTTTRNTSLEDTWIIDTIEYCFDVECQSSTVVRPTPSDYLTETSGTTTYGQPIYQKPDLTEIADGKNIQRIRVQFNSNMVLHESHTNGSFEGAYLLARVSFVDPTQPYDPEANNTNVAWLEGSSQPTVPDTGLSLWGEANARINLVEPIPYAINIWDNSLDWTTSGYVQGTDPKYWPTGIVDPTTNKRTNSLQSTNTQTLAPGDIAVFNARLYNSAGFNTTLVDPTRAYPNLRIVFTYPTEDFEIVDAYGALRYEICKNVTGANNYSSALPSDVARIVKRDAQGNDMCQVVDDYQGTGKKALIAMLDPAEYRRLTTMQRNSNIIRIFGKVGNNNMPRNYGSIQILWDAETVDGEEYPASGSGRSSYGPVVAENTPVTQYFNVNNNYFFQFRKTVTGTQSDTTDGNYSKALLDTTDNAKIWYMLSESRFGADVDTTGSEIVDVLPRAGVVDPKTGHPRAKNDLSVYLTGPATMTALTTSANDDGAWTNSDISSLGWTVQYSTSTQVQKASGSTLIDGDYGWKDAGEITDWSAVTAVKVRFAKLQTDAVNRVTMPAVVKNESVEPVASGDAAADSMIASDNTVGRRVLGTADVGAYTATVEIPQPVKDPITSMPSTGDTMRWTWWIVAGAVIAGITFAGSMLETYRRIRSGKHVEMC